MYIRLLTEATVLQAHTHLLFQAFGFARVGFPPSTLQLSGKQGYSEGDTRERSSS